MMNYHTLGVIALTPEKRQPIGVYTRVYSVHEDNFVSADEEVLTALRFLGRHFSKQNIRAMDRGYDANIYYEHFIKQQEKFIIRARKNRDVIYKGKRINILALADRFKGKYRLNFTRKSGDFAQTGVWYQVYMNYALEQGIIAGYDISDGVSWYTNRQWFASMISRAMDAEALSAVHNDIQFSDMDDIYYRDEVMLLARAGVITGADGKFAPGNGITRAEVAAIITRMVDPSLRK